MRGKKKDQIEMFSYIPLEARIPTDHPLRGMKKMIDRVLQSMNKTFDSIYSHTGRPSIAPEMLIKALFLQILYGIRSEKLILDQIEFNLLYRWFVGLDPDAKVWDESVFSKNRDRVLSEKSIDELFENVLKQAEENNLLSKDHFTVDGTLVEAWASLKSLKEDDKIDQNKNDGDKGNLTVDFKGEKRTNETHTSSTDPEAKIYTKSKGVAAKLCFMGHLLMENRNGIPVEVDTTIASYHAEHEAALNMAKKAEIKQGSTMGGDKHYDNDPFCEELRKRGITPHVAQNIHPKKHNSAVDGRTTRHEGYEISLRKRKRIEEIFGWLKTFGIMRRPHFRGLQKIKRLFKFSVAVYNVLRIRNLMAQGA